MDSTSDPLEALLVDAVAVDRERIAGVLAGKLALDRNSGAPVILPGFAELDGKAKLLSLLLAHRALELLGLKKDPSISPVDASRQTGMPGGTVRRMLPEFVEAHLASRSVDGTYFLSSAQIPNAISSISDSPVAVAGSRRGRARKPSNRPKGGGAAPKASDDRKPASSKTGRSPVTLVKELIEVGFFDEPRTVADAQQRLKDKTGHDVPSTTLAPTFTRLLRSGALDREPGERGAYTYRKHPGSS